MLLTSHNKAAAPDFEKREHCKNAEMLCQGADGKQLEIVITSPAKEGLVAVPKEGCPTPGAKSGVDGWRRLGLQKRRTAAPGRRSGLFLCVSLVILQCCSFPGRVVVLSFAVQSVVVGHGGSVSS